MQKLRPLVAIFVYSLLLFTPAVPAQSLISTVQLDLNNLVLVAIGSNLGPNPSVLMGAPTGALDPLNVTNSGPSFVVADLVTTAPGTYLVAVINGASVGFSHVTIGPQGEQGPPGPPGPNNPNIITEVENTALGVGALISNNGGVGNTATGGRALLLNSSGSSNTALGVDALFNNTTGNENTAAGNRALFANTTGNDNTAVGNGALFTGNGEGNTAVGHWALFVGTTGNDNTAIGKDALFANSGDGNTATGRSALRSNTSGSQSTAMGEGALGQNLLGSSNTAIGFEAGFNVTSGSNNIHIANPGQFTESRVIKIGEQSVQAGTFIAGISGASTAQPGSTVLIDTDGKLGTIASSRRFKQDIHDMDHTSKGLLHLRPVTFRYKKADTNGERPLQYGLIAEEVAAVYPELVVHNRKGEVQTVQYHKLNAMLLNEVQKHYRQIQRQDTQIQAQKERIVDLTERLARLEQVLTAPSSLTSR